MTAPKDSRLLDSIDDLTYARDLCHMISESHYKPAGSTAHIAAERIERALERLNVLLSLQVRA